MRAYLQLREDEGVQALEAACSGLVGELAEGGGERGVEARRAEREQLAQYRVREGRVLARQT